MEWIQFKFAKSNAPKIYFALLAAVILVSAGATFWQNPQSDLARERGIQFQREIHTGLNTVRQYKGHLHYRLRVFNVQ